MARGARQGTCAALASVEFRPLQSLCTSLPFEEDYGAHKLL